MVVSCNFSRFIHFDVLIVFMGTHQVVHDPSASWFVRSVDGRTAYIFSIHPLEICAEFHRTGRFTLFCGILPLQDILSICCL